jgi:hypothetical protein
MTQVPHSLPPIDIEGKKYPRAEFKNLIAQIATEHNITPFTDPVLVHLFEERESAHKLSKQLKEEFVKFQNEFLEKLKEHSSKIMQQHNIIEATEISIAKKYSKRTQ